MERVEGFRDAAGESAISLRLGFGTPPPAAVDVLGFWIVPLGLIAGPMLIALTTRFALWCARQARAIRRLP